MKKDSREDPGQSRKLCSFCCLPDPDYDVDADQKCSDSRCEKQYCPVTLAGMEGAGKPYSA